MPDPKSRLRRARLIHTMREAEWRASASAFAEAQQSGDKWRGVGDRIGKLAETYGGSKAADNGHMLRAERAMVASLNVLRGQATKSAAAAAEQIAQKRAALGEATERRKAAGKAAKTAEIAARDEGGPAEISRTRKYGTNIE